MGGYLGGGVCGFEEFGRCLGCEGGVVVLRMGGGLVGGRVVEFLV